MLRRPSDLCLVNVTSYMTERVKGDIDHRYAWQCEDLTRRLLIEIGVQRVTE